MKPTIILSFLLFLMVCKVSGTHIRAAEITYTRIADELFSYEFTVRGYQDTASPVRFGDGIFNFGDGTEVQLDLEAHTFEDEVFIGKDYETVIFTIKINHTYSAPGVFIVTYKEPNRNDEIININKGNSVQTPFYLQSLLLVDPLVGLNSSPVLNTHPIDRAYVGVTFTHNPWAFDPDGDSLSYRLVLPLQDFMQQVPNFELPNDPDFYINLDFGNEAGTGPATFTLDPITGDMVWDAPGNLLSNSQGEFAEYTVALIVEEWRKVGTTWRRIGYVTRDMQIVVSEELMGRPNFEIPEHTAIEADLPIGEAVAFADANDEKISVTLFSSLLDDPNPMVVSGVINSFEDGPLDLTFDWTPQASQIVDRPHLVHIRVTNDTSIVGQGYATTYKTWVLSEDPPVAERPRISLPPTTTVITSIVDDPELGIAQFYPNPADNTLFWMLPDNNMLQIRSITLINSQGQQTKWVNNSSSFISGISLENLAPGLYFVSIEARNANYRGKFIKK